MKASDGCDMCMPREHPVTLSSNDLDSAVKAILMGLTDPRADRKQWALDAALRFLCTDAWVDDARKEFAWGEGTAPM